MRKGSLLLIVLSVLSILLTTEYAEAEESRNSIGMTFVRVEAGSFLMGNKDESVWRPVHEVRLTRSYYIGKFEVTMREWKDVMEENPSGYQKWFLQLFRDYSKEELAEILPVQGASWYEATAFCNRLSEMEGLDLCYLGDGENITCDFTANGYRLPTEAEWEYAARGGQKAHDTIYSGSNDLGKVAWYISGEEGCHGSKPVGLKAPNEIGLHDMTGNVEEWCWDKGSSSSIGYQFSCSVDPTGPKEEYLSRLVMDEQIALIPTRIVRGGDVKSPKASDFYSPPKFPVYARAKKSTGRGYQNTGFRVVRTITE